ncbi:MAG: MarR family transcriptional regulator [Prevotella sp.]|jgi:DNA-binding MarR family transcriptional regulator|nr:MarR family transcriptional regulator [Prevotella sp.]
MSRTKELIENMHLLSMNVRQYIHRKLSELHLDITYEMVRVLLILSQKEHLNQQQIADITFKHKASLTSLIDNMQKRGLVLRSEDAGDRRSKIIILTERGKELVNVVRPVFDDMLILLYEDTTDEEINLLNGLIVRMNKSVEQMKA